MRECGERSRELVFLPTHLLLDGTRVVGSLVGVAHSEVGRGVKIFCQHGTLQG